MPQGRDDVVLIGGVAHDIRIARGPISRGQQSLKRQHKQQPFQLDVVRALRAVPYGEVVSYQELAHLAGSPRAQRAAGTFCARTRFPLVVPCHRVVSSDGLGSYGSLGLDYKRRLLELEGYAP